MIPGPLAGPASCCVPLDREGMLLEESMFASFFALALTDEIVRVDLFSSE